MFSTTTNASESAKTKRELKVKEMSRTISVSRRRREFRVFPLSLYASTIM